MSKLRLLKYFKGSLSFSELGTMSIKNTYKLLERTEKLIKEENAIYKRGK